MRQQHQRLRLVFLAVLIVPLSRDNVVQVKVRGSILDMDVMSRTIYISSVHISYMH